ncbi:MAG: portal protein [Muribaculaceae bacterium]|nr:portal protein [Muribaculaceae bacterium]
MAGFTNNRTNMSNPNPVIRRLRQMSRFGMNYKDDVIRNVRSMDLSLDSQNLQTNPNNGQIGSVYDENVQVLFARMSSTDPSLGKGYFNLSEENYQKKKEQLRRFALQDEIEEILDIICEETIVFDGANKFANVKLNYKVEQSLLDEFTEEYNKIYNYFGFYDTVQATDYFRKWLIDGFLAFEIVYNDDQTEIIGFVELDPASLTPGIDPNTNEKIWFVNQKMGIGGQITQDRILYDTQIIYLAYAKADAVSRISYVERLIRSFNILRTMEATRIIWAVTNASYKTQYIIPVGSVQSPRGRQTLAQAMANYKEVVDFDWDSGEIKTNGRPMLQFYKDIFMASEGGETPQIQNIGGDGPQISDTETLKYFRDKLRQASKIPFTRFEKEQGEGTYTMSAEGIAREEIRFSKFISRLRAIFSEILVKPLYIQMCLKHNVIMTDMNYRVNLGLEYNKDSVFEENKEIELLQKQADFISSIMSTMVQVDGEGNEIPYFDFDFIVRKYFKMSDEDLKLNKRFKDEKQLQAEGYKQEDIAKILNGEPKENFKPVKKKKEESEDEEGGGDMGGGNPLGGL